MNLQHDKFMSTIGFRSVDPLMTSLSFDGLNKGRYVELTGNGTKARRQLGFCDGVVISATYIKPGQLVAVEILETQPGWSGDLRVGFTLLPDESLYPLPSFAIPELVTRGHSWIFPVGNAASLLVSHRRRAYWRRQQQQQRRSSRGSDSRVINNRSESSPMNRSDTFNRHARADGESSVARRVHLNPASPCACCLYTTFGRVALRSLLPTDGVYLRPPDVEKGSIVAIYYELEACSTASMRDYSASSAGYFQWHSMPLSNQVEPDGDERDSEHMTDETVEQTTLPPRSEFSVSENNSQSQSNASHGSHVLDPLSFQFFFHIVINGIDLITISEKITLRRDQLCSTLPTSVEAGTVPVKDAKQSTVGACTPKMRAVLDVYGQTKAVRLVPLNQDAVPRLSRLSSCAILRRIVRIHAPKIPINGCNMGHSHATSNSSSTESNGRTSKRVKSSLFPGSSSLWSSTAFGANDCRPIWPNCSAFNQVMDNHRCKVLLNIVGQLPLPLSVRRELQRDACAIVWRELIE